jgi:hypothetical protein
MDLINCSLVLSSQQTSAPPTEVEMTPAPGLFKLTSRHLPSLELHYLSPLYFLPSLCASPFPSTDLSTQSAPLTSALIDTPDVLPGLSQPIESDESLLAVLNSSSPPQFIPEPASRLPIYRGKDIYHLLPALVHPLPTSGYRQKVRYLVPRTGSRALSPANEKLQEEKRDKTLNPLIPLSLHLMERPLEL